jgi:hypothetical protein
MHRSKHPAMSCASTTCFAQDDRCQGARDRGDRDPSSTTECRETELYSTSVSHRPIDGYEDVVRLVRELDDTGEVIGEEWHMDLA